MSEILDTLKGKRVSRKLIPFAGEGHLQGQRYVVSDPYLRFWLRFIEPKPGGRRARPRESGRRTRRGLADRPPGKGRRAIVGASLERLLPDERFGESRHISGYWTRDNQIEVDLVGSEEDHDPTRASLVGSIKRRENDTFDRHDANALQDHRGKVPRTDSGTLLVGISRQGFEDDLGLDVQLGPDDVVDAWR